MKRDVSLKPEADFIKILYCVHFEFSPSLGGKGQNTPSVARHPDGLVGYDWELHLVIVEY